MIYFIIIITLLILSYKYDYLRRTDGRNLWFWIMMTVLICVAGLRYKLGQDTTVYIKFFEHLHPINELTEADINDSRFSPGFIILCSFFRMFGSDFTVFQLFHSIVVTSVFLLFIRKHTRHVFFAILLFFFYLYFNLLFQQLRESLAASVFLLAWPSFANKKWIVWYISCFVALLFHVSSVFMLLLPIIYVPGIRSLFVFGKRTFIMTLAILAGGFIIQSVFFKYIELIAFTESMMERATTYSNSDLSTAGFSITGMIGKCIQWIVFPLIAMYFLFRKRMEGHHSSDDYKLIEKMAIMSVYVSSIAISIPILGRYNNYFYVFSILILSDWVYSIIYLMHRKLRLHYLYWLFLFTPMLGMQLYNNFFIPINKAGNLHMYMVYYPYSSFFDQTEDNERERTIKYLIRHVR